MVFGSVVVRIGEAVLLFVMLEMRFLGEISLDGRRRLRLVKECCWVGQLVDGMAVLGFDM